MATPVGDSYSCDPGGAIAAGRHVVPSPVAQGGTVNVLLKDWAASSGSVLLTTGPGSDVYYYASHGGSVWDESTQNMFLFGAETHANSQGASGMNNELIRFDVETGLFKKQFAATPWPGEYRIGADGVYYADAAHTKPWAMHVYHRMALLPSREIAICYDPEEHANWTGEILEDAGVGIAQRQCPQWLYSIRDNTFRKVLTAGSDSFIKAYNIGAAKLCSDGIWYTFHSDSATIYRLRQSDLVRIADVSVEHTHRYQNTILEAKGKIVSIGGTGSTGQYLYSAHDLTNPATMVRYLESSYAALTGFTFQNGASCVRPDGIILFVAHETASNNLTVFTLDVATNTVTNTGVVVGIGDSSLYDFKFHWSAKYNAAIWVTARIGGGTRAYAVRV